MRGTVRELAEEGRTEKRQKAPATSDVLISMVEHAPATLIGLRDRALLLLGFAGAFRRSEISALNIQDLEEVADGYRVHVRRSKTDQEGAGQVVAVVRGAKACPVTAVLAWLDAAGIADGPVFRPIDKVGRVSTRALTPHTIGKIVKRYAGFAGYNAAEFGGHSLRAGFATSAVLRGANLFKVMDVTRHKSTDTLRGYVRRAEEFRDHAGAGLL
jgi:integrase